MAELSKARSVFRLAVCMIYQPSETPAAAAMEVRNCDV
jgi:hypothetical protein